jgi:hypothetical protein
MMTSGEPPSDQTPLNIQDSANRVLRFRRREPYNQERGQLHGPVTRYQALLEERPGQLRVTDVLASGCRLGKTCHLAATLKKGAHVQLVGELRTREYEKEYGSNKKKFTVKQRMCEVALDSILKLDRAEHQEEPAPDIEPADDPA